MTMTVEELSRRSGVAATTVRYYTRRGLLRPRRDPTNQYRLFNETELKRLRFIMQAKWLGFSLSEIRTMLEKADKGESPCNLARKMMERGYERTKKEIGELVALQLRREHAMEDWSDLPDLPPKGRTICHLIESIVPKNGEPKICDISGRPDCAAIAVGSDA